VKVEVRMTQTDKGKCNNRINLRELIIQMILGKWTAKETWGTVMICHGVHQSVHQDENTGLAVCQGQIVLRGGISESSQYPQLRMYVWV
jgi:hypothetical protein